MPKKKVTVIDAVDGDFNTPGYKDQYKAGGFVVSSAPSKKIKDAVDITFTSGQTHHAIIGSTGSGKTVGPIKSSIISTADTQSSMILADPKGELFKDFSPYLRAKGYQVHLLDYFDVSSGVRFNQLQLINDAYREGLPHFYMAKAIEAIIKMIENIRFGGTVKDEYVLKYLERANNPAAEPQQPIYSLKEYGKVPEINHFKQYPVIEFPEDVDAKTYVSLIANFIEKVEIKCEEYNRGEHQYDAETAQLIASGSMPDVRNKNPYLIDRLREVINQASKLLNEISIEGIKAFFEMQQDYYRQLIDQTPDENLQKDSYIETHRKYGETLNNINQEMSQHEDGFIPIDILMEYLEEKIKLEKATFQSIEERAVKNANTIAEILIAANNEGNKKGEKIWEETPKAMIASLIILTARDGLNEAQKHMGSIYLQLANLTRDLPGNKMGTQPVSVLDRIFQHYLSTDFAKLSQASVAAAGDKTKSSIIVSTIPPTKIWSEPSVVSQCCTTDLRLESIVEKPTAIFLNFGGADSTNTYTFLVTLFIEQMYTVLNDICARTPELTLPRPVYFYLDEFCNLPAVPHFDAKISLARSKGIRFNFVAQSISQIDNVYTKEVRNTILENANLVYLLTNSNETAEFISKRLGKYTISVENRSSSTSSGGGKDGTKSTSDSTSTSKIGRELMTAEEVMNIKDENGLYIAPRLHPFKIRYYPSYKWGVYQKDIKANALKEIHQQRPHYEPEYFLPEDYENFIFAYMRLNNGCLFDELFNKWWTVAGVELNPNAPETIVPEETPEQLAVKEAKAKSTSKSMTTNRFGSRR